MSMIDKGKKWLTLAVLVTFSWLVFVTQAPLRAADEKVQAAPMAVEKAAEGDPAPAKKLSMPLVLVGAGILVVGALIFFLFIRGGAEKLREDFENKADSRWQPRTADAWSVADGSYICEKAYGSAPAAWWEWSLYDRAWTKPGYTVTARMRINDQFGPFGLLLVDDPAMEAVNGYQVMFYGDGKYAVRKVQGWNYKTSTAVSSSWIKEWTSSPSILPGLGIWNTFKLVKNGNDYRLFANDILVFAFFDSNYDPRYVALAVHTQVNAMHLDVDSFYVDVDK